MAAIVKLEKKPFRNAFELKVALTSVLFNLNILAN